MPIEIEVEIPMKPELVKENILKVLKNFLKKDEGFYLTGDIIYKLYLKKKSFIQKIFNSYIAKVYIYEDWMLIEVEEKVLKKVNELFEDFADSNEFITLCGNVNFKIKIRVVNNI